MVTNELESRHTMDRTVGNYRVVSEISYLGRPIEVPNDAVDVRVQPLAQFGATRVTYRQPLREVKFDDGRSGQTYIY